MSKEINILELFSGIGGFSKGLLDAGHKFGKHYFSEIDAHAIANYKYNFKNAKHIGSVTDVRGSELGRINIITFGSPCQDFSLAGNRKGMEGQRSYLILQAIRLIDECRPDFFIWENVKGVFSSNHGADFWGIIQAFTNIGGYRLEWQLLNTSWFLPQNRERIYFVGHLAEPGRNFKPIFPFRKSDFGIAKRQSEYDTTNIRTISAGGHSGGQHSGMTLIKQVNDKKNFAGVSTKQQDRIYDETGIMSCLSSSRTETKVNIIIKSATKKGFELARTGDAINFSNPNSETRRVGVGVGVAQTLDTQCNQGVVVKSVLTPNRIDKRQNGRRFKENGEPSFTLSCQDQHGVMIDDNIRRLTEIECERLRGFPDDWTKYGIYSKKVWINKKLKTFEIVEGLKEIPKTQRYKMCGNAVTTNVVKAIGERLNFK